ncbi:MAG: DUF167 domain-containing protein [Legionella sp.]
MWFKKEKNQLITHIYVKPKAKKSALIGVINDELHIAVHAKPMDGEANKELLTFIATFFKLPRSQISIIRGSNSRHKTLQIPINQTVEQFIEHLYGSHRNQQ